MLRYSGLFMFIHCVALSGALCAQTILTQSIDNNTILPPQPPPGFGGAPTCTTQVGPDSQTQREQSFCRTYPIVQPITITAVRFAVQEDSGPTTIDLRLWGFSGTPAFTTPLGTTTSFTTPGDGSWNESVVTVLLDQPIALGVGDVMIELAIRDNALERAMFWLGANDAGQFSEVLIISPPCGINQLTTLSAVGHPNAHVILDLVGYDVSPAPDPAISARLPFHAAGNIPHNGSVQVGPFEPGTAGNVNLQVFNRGEAANLTHTVAVTAPVNCTTGTATLGASTAPGAASTLTIPVTPNAAIGTFSFLVTITNNDPSQTTYSFTVNGTRGMSGTYTVDTNAANTPDYADIGDAFDDLEAFGMVGPVVIEISGGPYAPNSSYGLGSQPNGDYTPVRGNSSLNTITVRGIPPSPGLQPTIDGGGTGSFIDPISGNAFGCMSFHGLTNVVLEDLRFTNAADFGLWLSGTKFRGELANGAQIRRCIFSGIADGQGLALVGDFNSRYPNVLIQNCMAYGCGTLSQHYNLRGTIAFWVPGANVVLEHNSVLVEQVSDTPVGGCVAVSGSTLACLPITCNFNIFSMQDPGHAALVIPNFPPSQGIDQFPLASNRNLFDLATGASVATATANGEFNPALPQVSFADLTAWRTATGTLDQNSAAGSARFVSNMDLHVQGHSPALDLAVGSTVATDFDGEARPIGTAPDAGADERPKTGGPGTSLTITSSSLPNSAETVPYQGFISASATGVSAPFGWSITGQPAWLNISGNNLTGRVSGTPPAGSAGPYTFNVTVGHASGLSDTRQFTLTVLPAGSLIITTTQLPSGKGGQAYSQNIAANGGTPGYTWSVSGGTLPGGLSLGASTTDTVALSGTPTETGSFNFTIRVTDSAAAMAEVDYTLTIEKVQFNRPSSGGGGCSGGAPASPWAPLAVLAALFFATGWLRSRRFA